ncbi:MAG: hypothetical protein J0L75_03425 [Spirochaetes bacterium]|nr:hypothetical protein [Spirochaetota bacterium]
MKIPPPFRRGLLLASLMIAALFPAVDDRAPFSLEMRRFFSEQRGTQALVYCERNPWHAGLGLSEPAWKYYRGRARLLAYRQGPPPRSDRPLLLGAEADFIEAARAPDADMAIRGRIYHAGILGLELGRPKEGDAVLKRLEASLAAGSEYAPTVAYWRLYFGELDPSEQKRCRALVLATPDHVGIIDLRDTWVKNIASLVGDLRYRASSSAGAAVSSAASGSAAIRSVELDPHPERIELLPLTRQIESNADPVRKRLDLALLALAEGRYDGALSLAREAWERQRHPECLYVFARCKYASREAGAVGDFQACLKASPDFAPAWFWLGVLHHGERRSAPAVECIRRAASLEPSNPVFAMNLGTALAAAGDLPGAERELSRAEGLDSKFALLARNQGSFYARLKPDRVKAKAYYERYLSLEPHASDRAVVRGWISKL